MKRAVCLIAAGALSFVPGWTVSQAQALNPPYLSDMPSVERVMSAMKTADPRETAQRQIGAFYQLVEILKVISGRREFTGFTPDEQRIMGQYQVAQYRVEQAADQAFSSGGKKFTDNAPYRYSRFDPRFGVEGIATFQIFLPPPARYAFERIIRPNGAVVAGTAPVTAPVTTQAPVPTAQPFTEPEPGSKAALKRCIESGRSQRVCFSEEMTNGMDQMTGISMRGPATSGLRMTGDYMSAGGFRMIFQPEEVTMVCRGVPSPRPYAVELTSDGAVIKINNDSRLIAFPIKPDGKLGGSGTVRVTGEVPVGTTTEQTMGMTTQTVTRQRTLEVGESHQDATQNGQIWTVNEDASQLVYGPTGTRTVVQTVTKTESCTVSDLRPTGATPLPPDMNSDMGILTALMSGTAELMKGGNLQSATKKMLNPGDMPAPGLRLGGRYVGQNGFSITFHPETATLACGEAARALPYSIQMMGNQATLNFREGASVIPMQLRPDGSLFAGRSVQVNGRTITSVTEDPDNQYVFAPKVARCDVSSLTAMR